MKAGPGWWAPLGLASGQGHWLVVCPHAAMKSEHQRPMYRLAHDGWCLADMLGARTA